jgi:hypothetical protein
MDLVNNMVDICLLGRRLSGISVGRGFELKYYSSKRRFFERTATYNNHLEVKVLMVFSRQQRLMKQ